VDRRPACLIKNIDDSAKNTTDDISVVGTNIQIKKIDLKITINTEIKFAPINTDDDGMLRSNHNTQNIILEYAEQI
jgi:hypothetical protein